MEPSVFRERRDELGRRLGPGGAGVFFTAREARRNGDVDHEFRGSSDLVYLTGFEEPEAVAVVRPDSPDQRFTLFVRPRDPAQETWTGERAGVEGARAHFGADAAFPVADLEKELPACLANARRLVYAVGRDDEADRAVFRALAALRGKARAGIRPPTEIHDPEPILHEMRLRKRPEEVAALRRAAAVTAEAHAAAMREARPGMHEYDVQALLELRFRRAGSPRNGYPSIVGSGPNATTLHYTANRRRLEPGDLLLIDAGAEWDFYTADVTRTFPVGGRFTRPQRAVYEVVLGAQERAIAECRAGVPFDRVHETALRALVEGMVRIGLLSGEPEAIVKDESYKKYYMHRTSHWLGLDVHDVGAYRPEGAWRPLEPGMVLTVEPGIYVRPGTEGAPPEFEGIGVRIEDDVLVTGDGPEVLTAAAPKRIEEIERLTAGGVTSA
ncbi:MAG: aminopeptidase P N-terminal domain-containing protein [Planctomycetales bacterium]|nr:aminopeptidase P N-terminal domain-containing protein [Planctomycetales bacterium]